MDFRMSRRAFVRIITFLIAIITTLSVLFGINYYQNRTYRQAQEYTYQQAVEDLYNYLSSINSTLVKGKYVTSPEMMSTLATMLWRDSGSAKASLSKLPIDYFELGNTYKFIAQVGDYALSLSKKVSSGQSITQEEASTLQTMQDYCNELLGSVYVLQEIVRQGKINYNFSTEQTKGTLTNATENAQNANFGDGFKDFEESLGQFPSLVYDGPFSENVLNQEPLLLKGQSSVTKEQARATASKVSGVAESELKDDGDEEGRMPSYCFKTADQSVSVGVTKAGGFVTYFINSRPVSDKTLSAEQCIAKAKEYLTKTGVTSVNESYYEITDNTFSINFAYTENNVTFYPDLVKVSVAMDNGDIISFHQRGYLTNHTQRNIGSPKISEADARTKLSPLLTVQKTNLAVIPKDDGTEAFCYEFYCKGQNNEDILVYVNTQTGVEESLIILLISENGTLSV